MPNHPSLPSSYPTGLEHGEAVLAAMLFSGSYQAYCFLAENKVHFGNMENSVFSAGFCSLLNSERGEDLNIGVQGWGRDQLLL